MTARQEPTTDLPKYERGLGYRPVRDPARLDQDAASAERVMEIIANGGNSAITVDAYRGFATETLWLVSIIRELERQIDYALKLADEVEGAGYALGEFRRATL